MRIDQIEPSYWFTGMGDRQLQLLIYGEDLKDCIVETTLPIEKESLKTIRTGNNYFAIIHMILGIEARSGLYNICLKGVNGEVVSTNYVLKAKQRKFPSEKSINNGDCIYLVMPDRFASNKQHPKNIKQDDWHGGNLQGLIGKLDYISGLGITAIWCTPVFKNQKVPSFGKYNSYHGYSIKDFYDIDRHFGDKKDYIEFVEEAHRHKLKVIMDMVFNHCSIENPFVANPPQKDWINKKGFLTNYKTTTIFDRYASNIDKRQTVRGWFTEEMADLNLECDELLTYMTQMTLWWIETTGIDAIRMDTFLYSDLKAMKKWLTRLNVEYPGFSVIGETWMNQPAYTARTQNECIEVNPSFIVMDFAFQHQLANFADNAIKDNEMEMYNHFLNDILYKNPSQLLAFIDNHDMSRWFHENNDTAKLKQAIGILLMSPRIPQLYYGTEILLSGMGNHKGDGFYRQDFPGGWPDDTIDKTKRRGRSYKEQSVFSFTQKLLRWRKTSKAVTHGQMKHYIPRNGVYVFFRTDETEKVMIVVNSSRECILDLTYFEEDLRNYERGIDVITGNAISFIDNHLKLKRNEIIILQLIK